MIFFCICDFAENFQWDFQDGATPIMLGIIDLHHDLMFFLCFIFIYVTWFLIRTIWFFGYKYKNQRYPLIHGTSIEIIWTLMPCVILLIISIPSFALLYSLDEVIDPAITLKIIGNQWYWSYEYSDYISINNESIQFDSYLISDEDLTVGQLRMLEVDNRLVLPIYTHIRLLVTGSDVIHSYAIPSLGIKVDAIPGRLNQTSLFILREGVFYGACSELCGVNHAAMPIVIESILLDNFIAWIFVKLFN
uniref:cytochrome c oxidase subunit 2 n=1 Tax=Erythrolobus coxiae TaxID=362235 RepID=UPI001FCD12ED|nr:cytochrome c oxidase subunit 2 [Erythrolobus coxiae]UNJ19019.1 cytochrome c oxidase subunit 2 [Erythrolobus coxiae]